MKQKYPALPLLRIAQAAMVATWLTGYANAHSALCACYDIGDDEVLCQGNFSDGSTAYGVDMLVLDSKGNELLSGQMNEDGEFEFTKPTGEYLVVFDGGPGHMVEINGEDIVP